MPRFSHPPTSQTPPSSAPLSKLSQVLRAIDTADRSDIFRLGLAPGTTASTATRRPVSAPGQTGQRGQPGQTVLKLVIDEEAETWETWRGQQPASSQQLQQLLSRLETRRDELNQREQEFEAQVDLWEQTRREQQTALSRQREAQHHQQQQIERQQAQLVKLQQGLIQTQTAFRKLVEQIVENCEPETLRREMQNLRYELNESMEQNFMRWKGLQATFR